MRRRAGRRGGFTIIEMLVVIGIIVLLAGLLTSGIHVARQHARKKTTLLMFEAVALALDRYSSDFNQYPDGSGNAESAEILYRALAERVGFGPYLKGLTPDQAGDADNDGAMELLDGWRQPIRFADAQYLADVEGPEREFELRSAGADGEFNTHDDIVK